MHLLRTNIRSSSAVLEQQVDVDIRLTAQFGELRQMFPNLISNSLHAAGEGGKIRLRARTPA